MNWTALHLYFLFSYYNECYHLTHPYNSWVLRKPVLMHAAWSGLVYMFAATIVRYPVCASRSRSRRTHGRKYPRHMEAERIQCDQETRVIWKELSKLCILSVYAQPLWLPHSTWTKYLILIWQVSSDVGLSNFTIAIVDLLSLKIFGAGIKKPWFSMKLLLQEFLSNILFFVINLKEPSQQKNRH